MPRARGAGRGARHRRRGSRVHRSPWTATRSPDPLARGHAARGQHGRVRRGRCGLPADAGYREALARRGIKGDQVELVHIEPWTVGASRQRAAAARALPLVAALVATTTSTPTPGRSGGLVAVVDLTEMTVVRVDDHGDAAGARRRRGLPRRRRRRLSATTSARSRSRSRRAPASRCDGRELRWQKWRLRVGFSHRESLVLHEISLRATTASCGRSATARRSPSWSSPTAIPTRPCTSRTCSTSASTASARWSTRSSWAATASARSRYLDAACVDSQRRGGRAAKRDLHPRGGLRHPLEAPRRQHRPHRRRPIAAPGDLVHRHGRQLRVRLLLVPLPGRHDRVRGQADRDRADRRRAGRRSRSATPPRSRRGSPPATTSTSSPPGWTWTWTASDNVAFEVESAPEPAGPDNPEAAARSPRDRRTLPARVAGEARRVAADGAALAGREPAPAQPDGRARRLRAGAGRQRRADGAARLAVPPAGRLPRPPPVGDAVPPRRAVSRPASTPTSTRAATGCRAGRRPTGRSRTRTWCSGTRSARTTCRGWRTGR